MSHKRTWGQAKLFLNYKSLSLQYRHQEYIVDDVTYMRVKFYIDGSKRKGTVHVDLKKVRLSDMVQVDVMAVTLYNYVPLNLN